MAVVNVQICEFLWTGALRAVSRGIFWDFGEPAGLNSDRGKQSYLRLSEVVSLLTLRAMLLLLIHACQQTFPSLASNGCTCVALAMSRTSSDRNYCWEPSHLSSNGSFGVFSDLVLKTIELHVNGNSYCTPMRKPEVE